MNKNNGLLAAGLTGLCLLMSNSVFATNGYFTHGMGSRIKAMAGAGIASDSDLGPIGAANNPALAVFTDSDVELGLSLFSPQRSYSPSTSLANGQGGAFTLGAGDFDSSQNLFFAPYAAKNWRLSDDQAITLVAYGRGGMNTTWDNKDSSATFDPDGPGPSPVITSPGTYGGGNAGVDLIQLFMSVSYAKKYSDRFAWGIGPIVAVQSFAAKGVGTFGGFTETFAASGGTVMPTNLTNNGHENSYGVGLSLGLWFGITDTLSAGFSYQSEINMSDFDSYSDLFAQNGSFDIPSSLKGGLSLKASETLRLNLDVEHTKYSDIGSIGNPMSLIAGCPTAGLGGTNLGNCLGGAQGAGFGWSNMTTYKLGAEWQSSDTLTWRFGYSYGEQPIKGEDVLFNILAPGVIEQHFTTGFTINRANGNDFNVALMYAPKYKVEGSNMFDPTQSISIEMSQFEIEFSYQF